MLLIMLKKEPESVSIFPGYLDSQQETYLQLGTQNEMRKESFSADAR
jgi:hypothetical protein